VLLLEAWQPHAGAIAAADLALCITSRITTDATCRLGGGAGHRGGHAALARLHLGLPGAQTPGTLSFFQALLFRFCVPLIHRAIACQEELRGEPNATRRLLRSVDPTSALAAVQVADCGVFVLGEVAGVAGRTTLLGALGEWYCVASATASWALPARRAADAGREWAAEARAVADRLRDTATRAARDAAADAKGWAARAQQAAEEVRDDAERKMSGR
jgi:hypothetical protein